MQTAIQFSEPSLNVFRNHYLKKAADGTLLEKSPDDVFRRLEAFYIAKGVDPDTAAAMRDLQATKQFSFNSPTYYNADIENDQPQLLACFVGNLQDSMESITDHITRSCMIFKTGAGLGFNIGALRPLHASIGDGGKTKAGSTGSSGPLSFMRLFQAAGDTVMSAGKRRAAMWTGMRYDHPDIVDFVQCKRGSKRLDYTNMNISMIVDDAFYDMWKNDDLVEFRWNDQKGPAWGNIRARELLDIASSSVWIGGDPGLMFVDVINRHNTTPTYGRIVCFNPCGEICLPPDTACNLGAVVIYNVIRLLENRGDISRDPETRTFVWKSCRKEILHRINHVVNIAMEHLDKNIDINHYPDEKFRKNSQEIRPIGLGLSGLGEALCALGVPYGSAEAVQISAEIMNEITYASMAWSFDAANRLGPCPASAHADNAAAMERQLLSYAAACDKYGLRTSGDRWRKLAKKCKPNAYRNSYTTCIAPTGNTGIAFDAGSYGMEPLPGIAYRRNTRDGILVFADQEFEIQVDLPLDALEDIIDAFGGSVYKALTFQTADAFLNSLDKSTVDFLDGKYEVASWKDRIKDTWEILRARLSNHKAQCFAMMHDIPWMNRIDQQEALQDFTSLSISSTINVPHETTAEEIREIYSEAMKRGTLKGITVYRDGSIQFAPMTMTKDVKGALPDTMPSQVDTEKLDAEMVDSQQDRPALAAADKVGGYAPGGATEYGDIVVRRKIKRPPKTVGDTIELQFTDGIRQDKYYVTINEDEDVPGRPIEVFVNGGRHGENTPAMNQALGRLISGWLQDGAPVRSIVKKLVGIKGDFRALAKFAKNDQRPTRVLSIPDGVGKMLQRKYLDKREVLSVPNGVMCPECYHNTLVYGADGKKCWRCHNQDCGYYLC